MRDLVWMGSSLEDLVDFPRDVKRAFGFALREVQKGAMPAGTKPLPQFGSGVYELRDRYSGDAFRTVYAVKLVACNVDIHSITWYLMRHELDPQFDHARAPRAAGAGALAFCTGGRC